MYVYFFTVLVASIGSFYILSLSLSNKELSGLSCYSTSVRVRIYIYVNIVRVLSHFFFFSPDPFPPQSVGRIVPESNPHKTALTTHDLYALGFYTYTTYGVKTPLITKYEKKKNL